MKSQKEREKSKKRAKKKETKVKIERRTENKESICNWEERYLLP